MYKPISLATAKKLVIELRRRLEFFTPDRKAVPHQLVPIGSIRRQEPQATDIDLLVVIPANYEHKLQGILSSAQMKKTRAEHNKQILDFPNTTSQISGTRHRVIIMRIRDKDAPKQNSNNIKLDLFLATEKEKPFALFHYTGSKIYNIRTRALAKKKKMLLNQYGIFDSQTGKKMPGTRKIKTEQEIANFLGISYRSPHNRMK